MEPQIPPEIQASAFTVSAIEAAEEKKASDTSPSSQESNIASSSQVKEKIFSQMLKPPPSAVISDQIKKNEKARHEFEEVEKRKIFLKIQLYFERFPGLMTKIPKNSARTSLAEAEEILNQIHHTMDSMGRVNSIKSRLASRF